MEKCPPRRVELKEEALRALPVFPLEDTVFFPHTVLPLHVYEKRYQQMAEHALASDGLISVAKVKGAHEKVESIIGVGRILHHQRLEGGRFQLLLQGIGRVRILNENVAETGQLFRTVNAELLEEEWLEPKSVDAELREIQNCYELLLMHMPEVACALGELPSQLCCPQVLANMLCSSLIPDAKERQQALEENSIRRRLTIAKDGISSLVLDILDPEKYAMH